MVKTHCRDVVNNIVCKLLYNLWGNDIDEKTMTTRVNKPLSCNEHRPTDEKEILLVSTGKS